LWMQIIPVVSQKFHFQVEWYTSKAWKSNKPKKWYLFWEFTAIIWMLENTEGAIKNGQTRESGNINYTRQRQCVFGHHYAQTSTKYVNMTKPNCKQLWTIQKYNWRIIETEVESIPFHIYT
jgi:hypothetical protein